MRVLENLLNLTGAMVPSYQSNDPTTLPIETKIVGDEQWIRAISPAQKLSTYLAQSVATPLPAKITHMVEVNPEVDCTIYDWRTIQMNFCPAGVWTRLSVTINADSQTPEYGYSIGCDDPAIVGKWIRTRKPISVAGDQEPDIWLPPESALTPEQVAVLPPYGDYKEIKAF